MASGVPWGYDGPPELTSPPEVSCRVIDDYPRDGMYSHSNLWGICDACAVLDGK